MFIFTHQITYVNLIILEKIKSPYVFASELSEESRWYGKHDENPKSLIIKAGQLSMVFENGNLRYISKGKCEIIRMIYSAIRDKEWLTVNPVISDEDIELNEDSFRIRYSCLYKYGDINFLAHYSIEGKLDNSVVFSFEGEALNSFEKNRIGFCVLHPVTCYAGETCQIIHTNDESETLRFPESISPYQPFSDIKSMRWKISGMECFLNFYGDVFETEDQRNWTDASFKTYSTPLKIPYPVKMEKGSRISQRIELKVKVKAKAEAEAEAEAEKSAVLISIYPEVIKGLPKIGIGRSTRPAPLTDSEINILKELRFDHYRVEIFLFANDWKANADIAVNEAIIMDYPLEFALFFDDNFEDQAKDFIVWIKNNKTDIVLINLFHRTYPTTSDLIINKVSPLLKKVLSGIKIGCGTNANFAQLNRNRPESGFYDYITYSIHPQEHASDNSTLIENLQAQEHTVKSAALFANNKGIRVSPVNIRRRFNANISNFEIPRIQKDMPPQVDSRLMSLFGACWTVGSLKYLAEAGATGVTYYETAGERGIIQGDIPSRWPDEFMTVEGMMFPVFFVFKYLLKYKSWQLIKSVSSDPLKINCLILYKGHYVKIILVNFTSSELQVYIGDCFGGFTIKQLNSGTFADGVSNSNWLENARALIIKTGEPLPLKPLSVSFIDGLLNL
jgi:hypothetical protein